MIYIARNFLTTFFICLGCSKRIYLTPNIDKHCGCQINSNSRTFRAFSLIYTFRIRLNTPWVAAIATPFNLFNCT